MFPEFTSLFDFGVRDFSMAQEVQGVTSPKCSPTDPQAREQIPSFQQHLEISKPLVCMYCAAQNMPHTKRPGICIAEKGTGNLGITIPKAW